MSQRPRLLIIDDDADFRKLLIHQLRRTFFVVDAKDGCEGYSRAISSPPDAVILDMHMDGWNGIDTLRRFRSQLRLENTPVIVLTSDNHRNTVLQAIQSGANDFLLKTTLDASDLTCRIINLLPKTGLA